MSARREEGVLCWVLWPLWVGHSDGPVAQPLRQRVCVLRGPGLPGCGEPAPAFPALAVTPAPPQTLAPASPASALGPTTKG